MRHRISSTVIVLLASLAACEQHAPDPARTERRPARPMTASPLALLPGAPSIADVAERVTPSVVSVFSEKPAASTSSTIADPAWPFSLDKPDKAGREYSLGSGVIVSSDGVIVTNSHVVAQADMIKVALKDGRTLEAKVIGTDPKSDLAVLRVDAKHLPAIEPADSAKLRIGDLVLAIGNPFGIGQTVTMGIVSATGRANMGITDYDDFIQTDAAINPGNSGGALVNMDGKLVGINTAILSRSGGYQGIGFAIPSAMAIQIKDALLADGKVVRGWLGVAVQDLNDELAALLDVEPNSGVVISEVTPNSPAAEAGLERGDVITAIDGTRASDSGQVRNHIAMAAKGSKVHLLVRRDGATRSVAINLGELPDEPTAAAPSNDAEEDGIFEGVTVQELDATIREKLKLPETLRGVVVTDVEAQSLAALIGLRPGDVIMEINRAKTESVDAFHKATTANAKRALVLVYRDGSTVFMSIAR